MVLITKPTFFLFYYIQLHMLITPSVHKNINSYLLLPVLFYIKRLLIHHHQTPTISFILFYNHCKNILTISNVKTKNNIINNCASTLTLMVLTQCVIDHFAIIDGYATDKFRIWAMGGYNLYIITLYYYS